MLLYAAGVARSLRRLLGVFANRLFEVVDHSGSSQFEGTSTAPLLCNYRFRARDVRNSVSRRNDFLHFVQYWNLSRNSTVYDSFVGYHMTMAAITPATADDNVRALTRIKHSQETMAASRTRKAFVPTADSFFGRGNGSHV